MYEFNGKAIEKEALWWAGKGVRVFPVHFPISKFRCSCANKDCDKIGKHPRTSHGYKDGTTDEKQIRLWPKKYRQYNLGFVTGASSGTMVLDNDPAHGGNESLARLETKYEKLPSTWTAFTGGGGFHYIFSHPGGRISNRIGFKPGLDIRGDGGYIVIAPSVHRSGGPYAWNFSLDPRHSTLAAPPQWLLDEIAEEPKGTKKRAKEPIVWRKLVREELKEGSRNSRITSLAGHLLSRRIDPYVTLDLLRAFNDSRCKPPLGEDELFRCVLSIVRREIVVRVGCNNE